MTYLFAFVGWTLGSFLPTLEAAWLAYKQGQNTQIIKDAKEQINAAYQSNAKVAQAIEIKQQLDAAGTIGAERMRTWYNHLNSAS